MNNYTPVANINGRRIYDNHKSSFIILDVYETYPHNSFPYGSNDYDSVLNDVKLILQDIEVENYLEHLRMYMVTE